MKSSLFNSPQKQTGLSLIELMVALLISSILLLGVLQLFGSSSQTSRSANALARLQENGRLAMDLIAHEARRTGFNGCDAELDSIDEFETNPGGKITHYPDESLKGSTDKSLTFRYYGSSDGIKSNQCKKADLKNEKNYIQFINDGKNLRVISTATGAGGQILLNHANIEEIYYIQPCESTSEEKTCSYLASKIPPSSSGEISFASVQKIQVKLELCADTLSEQSDNYCSDDSSTAIRRTFSSLIELRNRL